MSGDIDVEIPAFTVRVRTPPAKPKIISISAWKVGNTMKLRVLLSTAAANVAHRNTVVTDSTTNAVVATLDMIDSTLTFEAPDGSMLSVVDTDASTNGLASSPSDAFAYTVPVVLPDPPVKPTVLGVTPV